MSTSFLPFFLSVSHYLSRFYVLHTSFTHIFPGTLREISTGRIFKATKGAPQVLQRLVDSSTDYSSGDDACVEARQEQQRRTSAQLENDVQTLGLRGIRSLAVARTNEAGQWELLGLLTFLDPPRADTRVTIERAKNYGVVVKMITGDHLLVCIRIYYSLTCGR